MTRERRLGRGLEALLGRMAADVDVPARAPDTHPAGSQTTASAPHSGQSEGTHETHSGGNVPVDNHEDQPGPTGAADRDFGHARQVATEADAARCGSGGDPGPTRVEIRQIDGNPFQPRRDFNQADLQSLCGSLRAHGLLQPIVVRRVDDRYQVVAGGRRLQAAARAGWTEVPVRLVEADDRQMAELAIIENIHRKDLNALEKAASFQRYLDQYGCTQEELAARLKLDRSTIANLIRLLELPEAVQQAIRQGKITPGHARALLPLGDEREQIEFCQRIQREGLSVRQTEGLVQETIDQADAEPLGVIGRNGGASRPRRVQSEHLAALEQEFRSALGTRIKIIHSGRGRGKLVIHFSGHEEFERLRRHICSTGQADTQKQVG